MAIPAFGLGTFRLKDDVVISSVITALELGYRAIDTAQIYDNEAAVGQAIAESGVPRHELYITTKIWIENLSKDKLIPSLKESLQKLRTDYVDLIYTVSVVTSGSAGVSGSTYQLCRWI